MAGEGSKGERGLNPLSNTLPLLNIKKNRGKRINLFERGIKGVSKEISR